LPGVNAEYDSSGTFIGLEVFRASSVFKDVVKLMEKKLRAA
jgi:hypothetical protein